ncbi:16S rRNA (cytosine(1402)-N(4))-methyltransferase RsmH [Alphaproteobacteria bacterium]|nr:16S rRNA (cytosine(1402)-N(4))-methyltransferase RsmH [Alphaproteobacteria bacterium]
MIQPTAHKPVMLKEVLEALSPKEGGIYVDGTFGAGGYSRAILDTAECTVIAIDRDQNVLAAADDLKKTYGDRFVFIRGAFGDVESLLQGAGFEKIDGFVLDIGVSSMQIDQAGRGFSFRFDAPLDMRMDQAQDLSAADIVNKTDEEGLANLIYKYGEERKSRRIAHKIVEVRKDSPIETTGALADIVRSVIPKSPKDKSDPATKTFQALRIAVNDELGELERALESSKGILSSGGRLVVVSFHSLEDRIVKEFLVEVSGSSAKGSRHLPETIAAPAIFRLGNKRAVKPSELETSENPRARSARLRSGVRL